ncbi:MAG: SAM-dependent methyltransferase [Verrucomicrobiota bacterium]
MPETFAAFMARALHDPQRGYYARHVQGIGGSRGDFATAATLSPQLGQAIAGWLKECRRAMPEVRHAIEVGAGNGALMQTVRKSLGWWPWSRLRWHIVETSVVLRDQQKQLLGDAVSWHETLEGALDACGGSAFIYHNELLDAFPVRLVQWQDGTWHEVSVEFESGRAREVLEPLKLESEGFSALVQPPLHKQQRYELHESVRDWLGGWTPHWNQGAMLTVDYGDVFPAVYHRRPRGTLRAYLMHSRLEGQDLYENVGRQDITADVNFTDYRTWTRSQGLVEQAWQTQAEFIRAYLPRATGPLLDSEGAGGAFKVVIHRRA